MKTTKKILLGYLAVHLLFMLIIGFASFTSFQDDESQAKLNPVGKFIANKASLFETPKPVTDFIFFYAKYTGTNRGYSFFSPNISPIKVSMRFMADGEEIHLPFKSPESFLKFRSANLHFNSNIFDVEEREVILKSISSSLFSDHQDIDKIDIYLDLYRFNTLESAATDGHQVMYKEILGFSTTKNKEVAMQTNSFKN
ncbi:hypothetical protein [Kordia jejudonensis]|uniref:hypothetical protein n=1 Tax=Kordia jejudonensis TaxID=1348245 RepID=UPI000629BB7A|nr:hypothetical protein [Kordia jejudonensis]